MDGDSVLSRLLGVFFSPGRAMAAVRERPLWLAAALIIVVITGVFSALTQHISAPEQMELMRDTKLFRMMPEEDYQQQYNDSFDPSPVKRLIGGLSGGVMSWIIIFIYGLLYLLFGKLAGGLGTFKQVMGVTFWAGIIPYGLGYLIRLPIVFAKHSIVEVSLGLAAFAPGADLISAKYQFLYFFGDLFVWWGLVVTAIGFAKVHGFQTGKAFTVTVLPWLLFTGFMFGLSRMFM
jgi:hypothetical protein